MKVTLHPKLILVAGLITLTTSGFSQIFFNNGAVVQINTGAIVQVNGGAENANSGQMVNNGDMFITNLTIPASLSGDLTLSSLSTASGDGKYYVENNFVNNATFNQGLSEVVMNSKAANQLITGSVVTTFHDLTLPSNASPGNPVVTMTLDANVDDILSLTDRELATNVNIMSVTNPAVAAVTNTTTFGSEGFVSSLAPGTLSRVTNSTSTYVYPVGSSLVTKRYRPIEITPSAPVATTYVVRMANNDANVDGFNRATNDGVMCQANPLFFHAINRTNGATPADIKMYYVNSTDGTWSNMSHWRTTNSMWNDMAIITPAVAGGFSTLVRSGWLFANPGDPYIMTVMSPAQPSIVCPAAICSNEPNTTFSANSIDPTTTTYTWTAPSGSTITSGQNTSTVNVNWASTAGQYILVYAMNSQGCRSSLADSCTVNVNTAPTAAFSSNVNTNNALNYSFSDLSIPTPPSQAWTFGDGGTGIGVNQNYTYTTPGSYNVILIITDANGCRDTVSTSIVVDYEEGLLIPNVFTPNGDGINDEFFVTHKGFKDFALTIFNRWGQKLYTTEAASFRWDGRDPSGERVTDGTYFYVLTGTSLGGKEYDVHGSFYVFLKK